MSALAAEFVGGRIGRLAFGADANQWLPTVATETLALWIGAATIAAVHHVPALVAGLFVWPTAINTTTSNQPNRPRAQPRLTGVSAGGILQSPSA